jgi:DNA-binding IclR family transcriptional regulator
MGIAIGESCVIAFPLRIPEALATPKTPRELARATKLPGRTLRYYLAALKRRGVIGERPLLGNIRRKIFFLNQVKDR